MRNRFVSFGIFFAVVLLFCPQPSPKFIFPQPADTALQNWKPRGKQRPCPPMIRMIYPGSGEAEACCRIKRSRR